LHALVLKAGATLLTLLAAAASAVYVGAHQKNASAPLHPAVLSKPAAGAVAPGGRLVLTPSIRSANVQAVTSTYAS
jgi:hypothetical protein